jgi:hypothetical protein
LLLPFCCLSSCIEARDLPLLLPLLCTSSIPIQTHVISTEGGALAAAAERPLYFAFAVAFVCHPARICFCLFYQYLLVNLLQILSTPDEAR